MPLDPPSTVEIDLVIVSDDSPHARVLIASLDRTRYQYKITKVTRRETMFLEFDTAIAAARSKRPVIVFLDCAFLNGQAEVFATRVHRLKREMAIECVATRPPAEQHRRSRLRALGASLFDDCDQVAEVLHLN